MRIKVCAYYTNEAYRKESERLKASMDELLLDYNIEPVPILDSATWHASVCYKPRYILDCLMDFPMFDVFYTDADSIFRREPDWQEFDGVDLAYHRFRRSRNHRIEFLTGSMFFSNTPVVRTFVNAWCHASMRKSSSQTPEQDALKDLLAGGWKYRLRIKEVGPEWCFIHDDMRKLHPQARPFLEHFQASRRLKRLKR